VGGARVYRVTPGGNVDIYAEGFTNLGALDFDSHGRLVVVEIVAGGLLAVDEDAIEEGDLSSVASRIVRIEADGSHTVLPSPGVYFATGLAIGANDELYVSNLAVTPFANLTRIDLP
jgi:sugar lactone lactonase YvrE